MRKGRYEETAWVAGRPPHLICDAIRNSMPKFKLYDLLFNQQPQDWFRGHFIDQRDFALFTAGHVRFVEYGKQSFLRKIVCSYSVENTYIRIVSYTVHSITKKGTQTSANSYAPAHPYTSSLSFSSFRW